MKTLKFKCWFCGVIEKEHIIILPIPIGFGNITKCRKKEFNSKARSISQFWRVKASIKHKGFQQINRETQYP